MNDGNKVGKMVLSESVEGVRLQKGRSLICMWELERKRALEGEMR